MGLFVHDCFLCEILHTQQIGGFIIKKNSSYVYRNFQFLKMILYSISL